MLMTLLFTVSTGSKVVMSFGSVITPTTRALVVEEDERIWKETCKSFIE